MRRRCCAGLSASRRIPVAKRDRQQRRKKRCCVLNSRCGYGEKRFQLVEALLGRIVCLEPRRSLQLRDERIKRAVGVVRRTLVTQDGVRLVGDALFESRRKAGLADPRLARDQHDLAFTFPGEALAFQQEIDLVFAADKIS